MKEIKGARVEDFLPYVSGTRASQTLQRHIALFLAKLSGVESPSTVKYLCAEEKGKFEQQYSNDNTRAAHMTKYRKGIASMSADRPFADAVTYEQETAAGPIRQHIALKWMNYGKEFHAARQAPSQAKSKAQRRERVAFTPPARHRCRRHRPVVREHMGSRRRDYPADWPSPDRDPKNRQLRASRPVSVGLHRPAKEQRRRPYLHDLLPDEIAPADRRVHPLPPYRQH